MYTVHDRVELDHIVRPLSGDDFSIRIAFD
eukprot:COSAG01_NODE_72656_length_252_cov_0.980392_1_plen_29_part_10